jgi:hypothetical protein
MARPCFGRMGAMSAPMGASVYAINVGGVMVEPLVLADFKNGVYTINGEAAGITDVIESNPDWGVFDPELIVPGTGLVAVGQFPETYGTLKSTLATFLTDGCTIIPVVAELDGPNLGIGSTKFDMLELPGWSVDIWGRVDTNGGGSVTVTVADGGINTISDGDTGVSTKTAFNISRTRVAASVNGRPAVGVTVGYAAGPFNTSAFYTENDAALESIGWYPLQDEADLPGLSAI